MEFDGRDRYRGRGAVIPAVWLAGDAGCGGRGFCHRRRGGSSRFGRETCWTSAYPNLLGAWAERTRASFRMARPSLQATTGAPRPRTY